MIAHEAAMAALNHPARLEGITAQTSPLTTGVGGEKVMRHLHGSSWPCPWCLAETDAVVESVSRLSGEPALDRAVIRRGTPSDSPMPPPGSMPPDPTPAAEPRLVVAELVALITSQRVDTMETRIDALTRRMAAIECSIVQAPADDPRPTCSAERSTPRSACGHGWPQGLDHACGSPAGHSGLHQCGDCGRVDA